jgi:hypothetical protein
LLGVLLSGEMGGAAVATDCGRSSEHQVA